MINVTKLRDLEDTTLQGDMSISKNGTYVYHIWDTNPVTPLFKQVRYSYTGLLDKENPKAYKRIEERVYYASVNFEDMSSEEIKSNIEHLEKIIEGKGDINNPYHRKLVNLGSTESPRWYPLPLLFTPFEEQYKVNEERNYPAITPEMVNKAIDEVTSLLDKLKNT